MEWHTWLIYLIAATGLSVTPGPNSLLVLTHGALYGPRRTGATIAGGALGFILLIALSMLGIGALLNASSQALHGLKWLGGAYLVWLGIQVWRSPALQLEAEAGSPNQPLPAMFRQGFLAAVSNPKALLFYGAFLPQFIDSQRSMGMQFLIMAGTFALIECFVEALLASLADVIRPALQRAGKRFNHACGGLFTLMGMALPLTR